MAPFKYRLRETIIEYAYELAKKELKLEEAHHNLKECSTPIARSRQLLIIEQYELDIRRLKLEIEAAKQQLSA